MGGTSPPSDAEKAGNKIDCHVAQLSWRDSRPSEWRQPCRPREGKGEGAPSLLSLWGCCHVGERLSADMRRIYSSPRVLLSAVALLVTRAAGADFYRDLNVRRSATAACAASGQIKTDRVTPDSSTRRPSRAFAAARRKDVSL